MRKFIAFAAAFALVAPAAATAGDKPPTLSQADLLKVQTRTYPVSQKVAMAAAVAALQEGGYLEISANRDAGTVTGHTDAKSKLMYNIFWGLGKKKLTQTAQFLVEELQPGQVNLSVNLFMNESKTRSIIFGSRMTDAMLVKQGEPYQALLTVVDQEVAKRSEPAAATSAAAPAAAGQDTAAQATASAAVSPAAAH